MSLAPIALFVYKRLLHTQQTVESLQKNLLADASNLFIFSDGPKSISDEENVQAVRSYVRSVGGFRSITVFQRESNLGLANSIVDGVTELVNKYGRVIVLEDDLVIAPYFLQFMNTALDLYEDEERVISIHGYMFPVDEKLPETFFLRGASSWGWATWSRAWQLFEPDGTKLLTELHQRKITRRFDLDGTYPYTKMLKDQIAGKNNSWAIRWHATAFLANCLTLFPGTSLVKNIGHDATGVHCGKTDDFNVKLSVAPINVVHIPRQEHEEARAALIRFYRMRRRNLIIRIFNRLRRIVKI